MQLPLNQPLRNSDKTVNGNEYRRQQNECHWLQAAGEREQGRAGAELADDGLERLGGDAGGLELLEDAVGIAEVGLGDDLGLAVDALADAGVVVGAAADDFLDEAGHGLGHAVAD